MFRVKLETPTPENCRLVELTHGKSAIVDFDVNPLVWQYRWRAIKWHYRFYAYSTSRYDGTPARIAMHRLIAKTKAGEVCHHGNGRTLDNRCGNLYNLSNRLHGQVHGIRRWSH